MLSNLVDGLLFDREAAVGRPGKPLVNEQLETLRRPTLKPDQRDDVIRLLRERTPYARLKLDWHMGQVFSSSLLRRKTHSSNTGATGVIY